MWSRVDLWDAIASVAAFETQAAAGELSLRPTHTSPMVRIDVFEKIVEVSKSAGRHIHGKTVRPAIAHFEQRVQLLAAHWIDLLEEHQPRPILPKRISSRADQPLSRLAADLRRVKTGFGSGRPKSAGRKGSACSATAGKTPLDRADDATCPSARQRCAADRIRAQARGRYRLIRLISPNHVAKSAIPGERDFDGPYKPWIHEDVAGRIPQSVPLVCIDYLDRIIKLRMVHRFLRGHMS